MPLTAPIAEALHRAGRGRLLAPGRLDAGLGDGAEVGDEAAGRAVRLAPRPGGRQLGQPGEAEQPLGDLRLGGEEPLAAQADPLDQAPHEDVGAALLHRRRGGAVELEEGLDPLPRLGLELGAVERRLAGGDHVELAAPGDRRQPRQVAGAQLDRRPGQRPGRRGRVVGVGEHPQPGDRVAHLGALEQRRRAGEVEGDAALLHRRGDRRRPGGRVGDERRRSPPAPSRRRAGARPRAPPPAPARARWCSARSCSSGLAEPAAPAPTASPVGMEVAEPGGLLGPRPRARRAGSGCPRASAARIARWAAVASSSSSTIRYSKRVAICRRTSGRSTSRQSRQEDVAAVEAAGLGEDLVVGGVELGELDLAPGRLARGLVAGFGLGGTGAFGEAGRPDAVRLERVDPRQQPGQQAGRVAADLVAAQRQLVEAVEQHRQPLGGAEDVEEGVEPGRLGVLAQEPLAERLPGADPELLEGPLEQRLDASRSRRAVARVEARTSTCSARVPSRPGGRGAAPAARSCRCRPRRARAAGPSAWASARSRRRSLRAVGRSSSHRSTLARRVAP